MIKIKKNTKILLILTIYLSFLSGCSVLSASEEQTSEGKTTDLSVSQERYLAYVSSFDNITTNELSGSDSNGSYFLYTGRMTCPYCLIFVPKLYNVSSSFKNNDITVKYLNSENEEDNGLESFREKNDIQYVPNFSYFEDGQIVESMNITDDTTPEEIQKFIDFMK